jgi:ferrochelatase
LIASALELPADNWSYSFQSRFGPQEWLQPYTDEILTSLAKKNFDQLNAACPGFAVDCLETIDEIGNEGKEMYHHAGGGEFHYLPALNDSPYHVEALIKILQPYLPR